MVCWRKVLYLPLHQLWKQYISHLLAGQAGPGIAEKLLKADFHGAIFTVIRSKCPTLIGVRGIVLQETENVLRMITEPDRLVTVPKQNSVFLFQHGPHAVQVYGNHIRFRASERMVRKFKAQKTIDL